jgi:YfiH family protein
MTNPAGVDSTSADMHFTLPGGGRALFTTRAAGNLSTMRGPGHERGREQRDRLCAELGLGWLCASRQVHGTTVQRVVSHGGSGGEAMPIDADGHATALRGVGVMVLVADCLPVVLGSEAGAVAALHAGWRGLAAGVLEEGVRALREVGGEGEIAAVIGPGAGPCCYEVGEEVHAAFGELSVGRARTDPGSPPDPGSPTERPRHGRHLDLPGLARARLEAAGVARVEDVGICTICGTDLYSHRREGLAAGRQAGIAWLEGPSL